MGSNLSIFLDYFLSGDLRSPRPLFFLSEILDSSAIETVSRNLIVVPRLVQYTDTLALCALFRHGLSHTTFGCLFRLGSGFQALPLG